MTDISGFGLRATIKASNTFPVGFVVTQFADDADPLDTPSITIGEATVGLNGDLITSSRANPLVVTLNVIPNSDDDRNLNVLFEANRVGKGKNSARDVITLNLVYPDGRTKTYTEGIPTDFMPGNSVASAGRMKTKPYVFAFENMVEA